VEWSYFLIRNLIAAHFVVFYNENSKSKRYQKFLSDTTIYSARFEILLVSGHKHLRCFNSPYVYLPG